MKKLIRSASKKKNCLNRLLAPGPEMITAHGKKENAG
jgi:hypothetical protein